jgi:hypothetical protein
MKLKKDKIGEALGLDPIPDDVTEVKENKESKLTRIHSSKEDTVEDDFDFARGNLLNIIMKGGEAVDDMIDFARQSQHPRSYEVLSTLLKTLADANKDLMSLQKSRKELMKESNPQTINNNLFVGSTTELQKMLKNNGND